ncbi:ATP-dependent DNA helicase [Trichonephila clavipes]|nr:ATP-dependent DNA helicase [Trichonephila clavipes]
MYIQSTEIVVRQGRDSRQFEESGTIVPFSHQSALASHSIAFLSVSLFPGGTEKLLWGAAPVETIVVQGEVSTQMGLAIAPGCPRFDGNNAPEVEAFIDTLITCSIEHSFSGLQRHKHTFTCLKKTRRQDNEYCRFNIPFFPMDRTRILLPLTLEDEQRDSEKFKRVRELLTQLEQKDVSMRGATFKEFLEHLNMSYEEYLLALRSGINRPTVVLKRTVNEVLINSYNPKILSLMQANMDIQFVLDEYAVVAYLVDYVNKPGRGLSKILRNCIEATAQGKHKECFSRYRSLSWHYFPRWRPI